MKFLTFPLMWVLSLATTQVTVADNASIGGYSPVAYFTEGQALLGHAQYAVMHEGKTYYLRNTQEVALFEASPDKYAPRYEICPYSLAHGDKLPIDPTNFQIVGGYLLLFHKSEKMDGLAAFEASDLTDAELLERADRQFTLISF